MSQTQHVRAPDLVPAPAGETWTTERVELLRTYVSAGMTCLQIAREIGVTRNAVIGKLNRLRLKGPPRARSREGRSGQRPRPSSQRRILRLVYSDTPPAAEASEPAIESANPCTLVELTSSTCRWPIGETDAKDARFCGNAVVAGLSYCAGHARIAYRISSPRRAQAG